MTPSNRLLLLAALLAAPAAAANAAETPAVSDPTLAVALGRTAGQQGYRHRREAARAIPSDLSPGDAAALTAFIASSRRPPSMAPRYWHVHANDLFNAARRRDRPSPDQVDAFIAAAEDTGRDPVVRDYAIQHLSKLHRLHGPDTDAEITAALWRAAGAGDQHRDTSLPGTALLALGRLAAAPGAAGDDRASVAAAALALAGDPGADPRNRLSAVHVCARLGHRPALPEVRRIARDDDGPVALRAAAIAAVGDLGNMADGPLLQSLSAESDIRLRAPATAAQKKLAR